VHELRGLVGEVAVYDPVADAEVAHQEYGISLHSELPSGPFDAVVLASSTIIAGMSEAAVRKLLAPNGLISDAKGILPASGSDARL
jgi:hypothetical protein